MKNYEYWILIVFIFGAYITSIIMIITNCCFCYCFNLKKNNYKTIEI